MSQDNHLSGPLDIDDSDPYRNMTGYEMVEHGIGLIARGLFRQGHSEYEGDPVKAYELATVAASCLRDEAVSWRRKAEAEEADK